MNLKLSLIKISTNFINMNTNFIKMNTNFMFPDVIYQTSCKGCSEDCVKTITGIKLRMTTLRSSNTYHDPNKH